MPGKIKAMIDQVIEQKSAGNSMVAGTVRTKLLLKGIDPSKFDANSPDDSTIIQKIRTAASEMGVHLK